MIRTENTMNNPKKKGKTIVMTECTIKSKKKEK